MTPAIEVLGMSGNVLALALVVLAAVAVYAFTWNR